MLQPEIASASVTAPPPFPVRSASNSQEGNDAQSQKYKVHGRLRPASLDEILKAILADERLATDKAIRQQLCLVGVQDSCSSDEEACKAGIAGRCTNGATPGQKRNKLATIQLLQKLLALQEKKPAPEDLKFSADYSSISKENISRLKEKSERFDPKRLNKLINFLSNYTAAIIVSAQDKDGKLIATTTTDNNGEFAFELPDTTAGDHYIISSKADNFHTKEKVFVAGKDQHVSLGIEDRPVSLFTRAVVGYQQAGAASTAFEQNYFFDLFVSQSLPFKQKIDPDFGEPFRTWGAIRAISAPQSGNVTIGDLSTNFVTKVKELKANEAARVFDYLGGVEYRLPFFKNRSLLPSFDKETKQKFTLSFIASGGFVTPTNPNEADPKAYKITDTYRERFKNEAKGSDLLVGNELDGKDYVAFSPTDRDRFFRQYYAGIRMQTFFFNRHDVPIQRFPVQLDLQYGINEYVTSGRARGGVFRLDGYFPLPYDSLNFINLFGTAIFRPVRSKIEKTLILEEADGKFFDSKTAVLPVSQFNRDYYRVGVGIDFISFVGKLLRN